jgi:hypothetical protein
MTVTSLEARILADAARYEQDKAEALRWIAEGVLDGQPFLASTQLDLIRGVIAEPLRDDMDLAANYFAELVEAVRQTQLLAADPHDYLERHIDVGDSRGTEESVSERLEGDVVWALQRLVGGR